MKKPQFLLGVVVVLLFSQLASIIGGLNLLNNRPIEQGLSQLVNAGERDGYQLRYKTTTRGAIVFSGNSIGLNTFNNIPPNPINGSIDAYSSPDSSLQVENYPSGTTKNWEQNGSSAQLDLPTDTLVLYAELIWGANFENSTRNLNVRDKINNPITLITPQGPRTITPDINTASETSYGYIRSAEVTSIIQSGGGEYTVKGVPGIIDPLDKSGNYAGWTLAVVYAQASQPIRNLTFYTGSESVFTNRQDGNTVDVTGFGTPLQGAFQSKILVSTQEGDSDLSGDQLLFGKNSSNLEPLSGPNNNTNNFFAAQINNSAGQIDTRGTFGSRNQPIGSSAGGRRQGWDITSVDVSNRMENGQSSATIKGTSTGDIYVINALGVQIDVNAPNPIIEIARDKEFIHVGETIKYNITISNDGIIEGQSAKVTSLIPTGTTLVPGTMVINGQNRNDVNPATGSIDINNITPGQTQTLTFEVQVNSIPPSGTFENEATVSYQYTPIAGSEPVQEEKISSKVVTFPLTPIGLPPVATDDAVETRPSTPVSINVPTNDTDPENSLNLTTVMIKTQPQHGTVAVNRTSGVLDYTPTNGYTGIDTLEYTICDTDGNCDQALVTITIRPEQLPIAENDTAQTKQGIPVNIPIVNNDEDPLADQIIASQLTIESQPQHGTVTINPTTSEAIYTPTDSSFIGTDTFDYKLCNRDGCDPATVNITINERIIPNALNDGATTKENTPVEIPLLTNDTPGNGATLVNSTLQISEEFPPSNGTLTLDQPNGKVVYTPQNGFVGTDNFSYTICNSTEECDTAEVVVTVTAFTPPTANDDNKGTDKNTPVSIPVLDNDTVGDSPLVPNTVRIITPPTNGTTSINPSSGVISYTPNNNYTGPDTLLYEVCDQNQKCDTATVSLTISPVLPPAANPDTATTLQGDPVEIPILTNDLDPLNGISPNDFDEIVTPPQHGTVTYNSTTGRVLYTPNPEYLGNDSFTYKLCNEDGCDDALVSINVAEPASPIAVDDIGSTPSNQPITTNVLANDNPGQDRTLNPQTLALTNTIQPQHGTVTRNSSNQLVYTPNQDYSGNDSYSYQICNDRDQCDEAVVNINVTPLPRPDTIDDTATTPQNQPVSIPIFDNDLLPSGTDVANITFPVQPINGTITNSSSGLVYTPSPGFTGNDRLVYTLCTTQNQCDSAEVRITVTPIPVTPNPTPSPNPNSNPTPTTTNSSTGNNTPTPNNSTNRGSGQALNNQNRPPRQGQVLGAYEDLGNTPRTGAEEDIQFNLFLIIGLVISTTFFASLYFVKSKQSYKQNPIRIS